MRIISAILFILSIAACDFKTEKTKSNPPIFINFASQVLRNEIENAVLSEEKMVFKGYTITENDSTISELEISIKEVNKVPFDDELYNLGQKIGTATKTILVDTNQYQRYKITFKRKEGEGPANENPQAQIIVYAKDLISIPLNSPQFKEGMLKR